MIGILVGPIVIAMVELSILKGKKIALVFGLGVWLSDTTYIYLTHIGLSSFLTHEKVRFVLGILGGIVLMSMGIYSFLTSAQALQTSNIKVTDVRNAFFKGVMINIFNPFVVVMWIGIYAYLQNQEASGNDKMYYFIGFMSVIITLDITRIWISSKVKHFISGNKIAWIRKVAGVGLVIFGIAMIFRIFA